LSSKDDLFVAIPLRIRQEHADWSNAEHAAWLDLFMASYPLGGTIESLEVARAYLGRRAAALPALVQRGAFAEVEDGWRLADYDVIYDGKARRSNAERVALAAEKQKRGEPLSWADYKALERSRVRDETKDEEERERYRGTSNGHIGHVSNGAPAPSSSSKVSTAFHHHQGHVPSTPELRWLERLAKDYGDAAVVAAMEAEPKGHDFLERVEARLQEKPKSTWTPSPADLAIIEAAHPRPAA
jgi:hypothetical protein